MRLLASLLAVVAVAFCATRALTDPVIVNGFGAIVNNRLITYEDIDSAVQLVDVEAARIRFGRQPGAFEQEVNRLRQEALIGLIERELILSEFHSAGYQLPETLIDERIKERIREDYYGDRARFIQTLQAQDTTLDRFRERIRERFILEAMTAKHISSAVLISPFKIQEYYRKNLEDFQRKDRVQLRMISLWHRAERGPEATLKLAQDLREQLLAGANFADLASLYSDDPARRQGGDRGWIERESKDLREDLQVFAFSLSVGQPSEVFERDEGAYLMLVEEREDARTRELSEVRGEIEGILLQRERNRLREAWINRLRAKSFVRYFPLN
jgi:parvulin-like peptidyl-prolyl isomerase